MIGLLTAVSLLGQAPELPRLPAIQREAQITYLDRNGAVLGTRGGRFKPPADLKKLPAYVPAAFVAIEDRRFYGHTGFDALGIARAVVADIEKGRAAQGASTITQQLARNLFLTNDRTAERKVREIMFAIQLERTYSKPQILGLYLSRVYFGSGAYGIEAAAQRYFNKPAARLSVREAAMLAAILKAPSQYNPADEPEKSAGRTALVLDAMVQSGAITPAQRAKALAEKPHVWKTAPTAPAQYYINWVDAQVRSQVGAVRQDLVVQTTLDMPSEAAASRAANAATAGTKAQAAVVAVDGAGRVRTMVGGLNDTAAPFTRAVDARRQAGSAWKPFVYLTALQAGRTPESPVVDEPVTIAGWSPRNYEDGFAGPMSLEQALAQSVNTVAVRLADEVGRENVAANARRLGITTRVNVDPAMALGTTLVSPLEMAQAYAVFSNGGNRVQAYGVERIRTAGGKVLYQRKPPIWTAVTPGQPLNDLNRMLRTVMVSGTGTRAQIPGYDLAGKTGTTSDYKDAWFCGFTGGLAACTWMGRDDARPLARVTGGAAPAVMWKGDMQTALKRLAPKPIPSGAVAVAVPIPVAPPAPPPEVAAPAPVEAPIVDAPLPPEPEPPVF